MIVKVLEVIATSEISFDDAIKNAVKEVSKTVKNIDSVYVKDMKCHVKDGEISTYPLMDASVKYLSELNLKSFLLKKNPFCLCKMDFFMAFNCR